MKIRILSGLFFTLSLILIFYNSGLSQTNTNLSPVNWVNYSVLSSKVSFLMPKLPIVINESHPCRGEETFAYGSYAEGAAFVVRITKKTDVPSYCPEKKEFDKTNFEDRVSDLKTGSLALKERNVEKSNEIKLEGADRLYKLINDSGNNRWFEFWVVGADENKPEVKNFFSSLRTGKKVEGIKIGAGAEQALGDEAAKKSDVVKKDEVGRKNEENLPNQHQGNGSPNSTETPKPETSSNISKPSPIKIILKPRATYTDQARQAQTQGKVTLRVTFSANGSIGAISVISGLPDGLTEQAFAAARRILFIPAKKNRVPISITKPVEYSFTIY